SAPNATAAASPTSAPPVQGKLESYISYFWPIIAGFVGGIAGVVAAIISLANKSIQLIKDRGHFWDTHEPEPFKQTITKLLIARDSDVLRTIKLHGEFVTETKLNEAKSDFDRRINTIEETLRDEREKKENFEKALMMAEFVHKF